MAKRDGASGNKGGGLQGQGEGAANASAARAAAGAALPGSDSAAPPVVATEAPPADLPAAATPPAAVANVAPAPHAPAKHARHKHPGDHAKDSDAAASDDTSDTAAAAGATGQSNPTPDSQSDSSDSSSGGGGGHISTGLAIGGGVLGAGILTAVITSGGEAEKTPARVNQAPVGNADSYTTAEDTTLTVAAIGVLTNDTDVDNNTLNAVLVSGPSHGTLTLNSNGSFSYTPAANYNGSDSFSYKPNDGTVDGNTVTVSLTVTAVNDAPVAVADSYTTNEDTTLTVAAAGVLTNDTDVDGNALTATLVSGPSHGTLTLNANGSFSYTPTANYNGADSFTYKANDGTVDGNIVTVSLTVTAINDAPVTVADSYSTNEDTTLTVAAASGVLANDTDVDGNPLTALLVSGPAHGSLTLNANGSFSYTPTANYNGSDSFTYKANDGTADGNTVTVTLTVNAVNDAPVATADSYTTNEDTTLTVAAAAGVLANDTDVEGSALTAVLVSGPSHGSLTLNTDGSFSYTPTANYNGSDSFTYKANDGTADSNTVTVSLTVTAVNDAPVAAADSYTTNEDTTLTVAAAAGVLANDTDVDGNPLTAVLVSGPTHGSLTLNTDGSFSYTPTANYNGSDSFTYKANDGTADSNTVTVSLTVTAVNDAPVAVADSYTTNEDTTLTVAAASGVLANDTDVEGSALTAVLVSGPSHGSLTLNPNGSFSYTPTANYNGSDSFTYKANDGTTDGNTVTVSLTVNSVNDAPAATADSYSTNEDTTLTVAAASGVLANDTDVDGNPLTAVLVSGPSHGSLTLNPNGSFSYTPTANYNGSDSFTYKANDGTTDGNTVTVSLTINPVNDAPVATADSYTTNEDTTLTVAAASGVLANDTDVEGSALTAVLVSGPSHGSLTLNPNGSFSYTPTANYNGSDSFTYKANDGTADGNTVTVSLTVTAVNDAPVATADSYSTNEDTTFTVAAASGVLANDTDVDGNPLTATLVSGTAHGALTFNADGSFSYTPTANYNGSDSFTYKVNDGTVDGNTVTVSLTVNSVNDAPVATADSYTTNEDTTLIVAAAAGVLANDSDVVEGSPLTAVLVTGPSHGSLTLNPDGSFSYTPTANYNGSDSFTYKPNDGTDNGNTVTVSLTVTAVNDAPVAAADSYTTNEDTTLTVAAASGVLANDTDVDGNPLTAVLVSGPTHGSLTLNADGSFSYTPTANYNGSDSFTYKANDGSVDGNTVTVSLTVTAVNDAPVATADSYSIGENGTLVVTAASGVLANDTDVDGNTLTAAVVSGPSHGSLTLNPDGSFNYTPTASYNGTDSFTYKANDGTADSNTVTVNLTITPANIAPVATADSYSTNEDVTLTVAAAGVLTNDTDADSNPLTAVLVSGPSHGSLTLNPDGSFSYTPTANYNGSDSFTYKPNDGVADGNTVTVSLTINPVNDAPAAVADSYTFTEDSTLIVIPATGVLVNDTDVEGSSLTAVLVSGPSHGSLTLNPDGSFNYTPTANYNGTDSFTYKANDGSADSNTTTVTLTITPVNDAPVAVADSYSTNEDTTLNVAAVAGVLANDTDVDGNVLTAVQVSGPAHGTLLFGDNGSFIYIPTANYNGTDSFTYKANDGTVDGNTVTVSLTINPVNDAPVTVADSYTLNEDTTLTTTAGTGVRANDTDVDGNTLTAVLVSGPTHASSFTLNSDGSFSYTPTGNYNGSDSFTYKANDGTVDGNTVTVSLTINPVNDAPVTVADSYTLNEDTTLTTTAGTGVRANDTDVDGNTLTAVLVSGPTHASSFTLNSDGSFSYTPTGNYSGSDSFTYKANDGTVDGNTVTVSLTINPINDAPVVTASNTLAYTENDAATAISSALTLSDVDSATLSSATVAITSNYASGQDVLGYTNTTKFSGSFNSGTGVLTLSLNGGQSATLADWQTALRAVTYSNSSDNPSALGRTITFTADDGGSGNNIGTAFATVNVTAVNDVPVVTAGNTLGYTENGPATAISSALTLSDSDSSTLSSASVGITNNFVSGQDVLGYTNTTKFSGSFDSGTGVLTLTLNGGQSATLADWQTALRSVTYNNTSDAPSTLARTVTYTADDGGSPLHIGTGTATINVTAVNDAPTASAPSDASLGTAFSHTDLTISGLSVADVDAGTGNVTATVSSSNAGLTFTTTGLSGSTGNGTHTVTLTGTVAQVNAALATLTYNSDDGYTGSDTVTLSVNDNGNTGTGGSQTSNTATFHVGVVPQVFIIDNTGGGTGGNGSAATPFKTIADFNASSATGTGDYIYLRQGTGTYSENDGINLKASEHLYGQGQTLQFTNPVTGEVVTIGTGSSGATPTISVTGASQHGIDLSTGNEVTGLNVATTLGSQVGIQDGGGTVGNLTVTNVAISGQGQIVDIDQGGTLAVTLNSVSSTGSTGSNGGVIDLTGTGGSFTVSGATTINGTHSQAGITTNTATVTFSGATTINNSVNTAVSLGGGTLSFAGGLDIDTTSGTGIASTGGTLNISGGTNTVDTTTGQILSLANTAIGTSNVTFNTLHSTTTGGVTLVNVDGNTFNGGTVSIAGTAPGGDALEVSGGSSATFNFGSTTISSAGDDGIELNGANGAVTFSSVNINNTGDVGLLVVGNTNAVTVSTGSIGATNDPTGDGVNISGGSANITISATVAKTTTGNVAEISGRTGGTVALQAGLSANSSSQAIYVHDNTGGTITFGSSVQTLNTGTNTAVNLVNNTGATINFTGGFLDIDTTTGTGFSATGGGTVNVTGASNSINSTGGTALNVANTTIGASNLTFHDISSGSGSNSAGNGIILDTTGTSGGLHITGTTTAGSGGTIQHKTGADGSSTQGTGIYLNSTYDVQLNHMALHDFQNDAIYGATVNGFTLANSTINGTNGDNASTEGGVYFTNLTGTASVTNSTLSGGAADNLSIVNDTGTLTLAVSGSTVSNAGLTGIMIQGGVNAGNAPTITANIDTTSFAGNYARHIQAIANAAATMTVNIGKVGVAASGGTFSDEPAAMVDLAHNSTGNYNFNVQNTTMTVGGGGATVPIIIYNGSASGSASTFQGKILNNTITGLNSGFDGIELNGSGPGTLTALVSNNVISNISGVGIWYGGAQTSYNNTTNLTITNNVITMPDANASFGVQVAATSSSATGTGTVNLTLSGNNVVGNTASPDYRVEAVQPGGTIQMPGYTGGTQDTTAVKTFVAGNNQTNGATTTSADVSASVGSSEGHFTNTSGGAATPQPNNSSPLLVNFHAPIEGITPADSSAPLTQGALDTMVDAAIARWAEAGATAADIATMKAVQVTLTDIPGSQLGEANPGHIEISATAGGYGWFVDPTPGDDSEFVGNRADLNATAGGGAAGRLDLLTTLMHELGHQIGLGDDYVAAHSSDLMYGFLDPGERRLPQATELGQRSDEASQALATDPVGRPQHFGVEGGPAIVSLASLLGGDIGVQGTMLDHATPADHALPGSVAETAIEAIGGADRASLIATELHPELKGGLDLSGLGDILSAHAGTSALANAATGPAGGEAESVEGWKVTLATTLDFGTDHNLGTLLAHLDDAGTSPGAGGTTENHFDPHDFSGVELGPQIDVRPDAFGQPNHAVL